MQPFSDRFKPADAPVCDNDPHGHALDFALGLRVSGLLRRHGQRLQNYKGQPLNDVAISSQFSASPSLSRRCARCIHTFPPAHLRVRCAVAFKIFRCSLYGAEFSQVGRLLVQTALPVLCAWLDDRNPVSEIGLRALQKVSLISTW